MESVIEDQRCCHEERERIIDAMVKEMTFKKTTVRDKINSDHRIKMLLERYISVTTKLKELYDDDEGIRKLEVASLSSPNEFTEFYTRLRHIKEFYRKHPNEISIPMSVEFEEIAKARENPTEEMLNLVEFSDEEGYGKYLDLIECYELYINLKGVDRIDYITYLSVFDQLHEISKSKKMSEYKKYTATLVEYLYSFVVRTRPLYNIDVELEQAQEKALKEWENGNFPGWPKEASSALSNIGARLDLREFNTWEDLAALGLDRLKTALIALNLKCGGTLEERAKRLFATKTGGLTTKDLAKKDKADKQKESARQQEIVQLECQVYKLAELVNSQRAATKENIQRRQARADGEREESEDEVSDVESIEDDKDDIPYNPKNLPLGWDGKPIPYWLYKLHGLNISYNCEICGNFVYKGPKAFQMHFAEWRHAHGMRCLGIPNTAHFANVTQIEDAIKLWEKLKTSKQVERWIPEAEEEFEDSLGNVVNKKTYEDLKRQGLL